MVALDLGIALVVLTTLQLVGTSIYIGVQSRQPYTSDTSFIMTMPDSGIVVSILSLTILGLFVAGWVKIVQEDALAGAPLGLMITGTILFLLNGMLYVLLVVSIETLMWLFGMIPCCPESKKHEEEEGLKGV